MEGGGTITWLADTVNWLNFVIPFWQTLMAYQDYQHYNFIFKWPCACYNWLPDVYQTKLQEVQSTFYSLKQRWTYCDFWFFCINIVRCPWSSVLFPEHQTCTQSSLTQQHHQKHHQVHIHCPATHIEILLTTISKHFTTTANTKHGKVHVPQCACMICCP